MTIYIYDAITACKITPDDGYGSISEYVDNCEKYIKYHYLDAEKMKANAIKVLDEIVDTKETNNNNISVLRYIIYELPKRFPNIRRGVFDATGVGKAVYERVYEVWRAAWIHFP